MKGRLELQRFHQVVFLFSVVALSWFAMMAIHELGHVAGAVVTGGQVERVVLHPLTISRTDVKPNPNPLLVVWAGPLLGCMLPTAIGLTVPKRFAVVCNTALFFAGFCLLANGAYIGVGAFDSVGDCGEMLKHGSPIWLLLFFGAIVICVGFYLWHCLGSVKEFLANPSLVNPAIGYTLLACLVAALAVEFAFSPR